MFYSVFSLEQLYTHFSLFLSVQTFIFFLLFLDTINGNSFLLKWIKAGLSWSSVPLPFHYIISLLFHFSVPFHLYRDSISHLWHSFFIWIPDRNTVKLKTHLVILNTKEKDIINEKVYNGKWSEAFFSFTLTLIFFSCHDKRQLFRS